MVYILGVAVNDDKPVRFALLSFYGIGHAKAEEICAKLSFHNTLRVRELTNVQLTTLSQLLSGMTIEGDLRRQRNADISRLVNIRCYRGMRHVNGYEKIICERSCLRQFFQLN